MESSGTTEPGSPYPTYYDLDHNRLYTPQRSIAVMHNTHDYGTDSKPPHIVTKHERSVTITSNIAAIEEHSWSTDNERVPHFANSKVFFTADRLDTANDGYPQSEFSDVQMLPQPTQQDSYSNDLINLNHSWSSGSAMESSSVNSPTITSPKPNIEKKKRGRPYGSKNKPKEMTGDTVVKPKKMNTVTVKNKKKAQEEIAVNTLLSIDAHSDAQLSVTSTQNTVSKKKIWGPFVHIEKDVKSDKNVYSIVNIQKKLDDDKDQKKVKPLRDNQVRGSFRRTSLSKKKLMNLSQQSDTLVRDTSWKCVFCKQGSHYKNLGDLFGPYYVNIDMKMANTTTDDSKSQLLDVQKKRSESSEFTGEKRGKRNSIQENNCMSIEATENKSNGYHSEQQEVWFHEDCIVWSNGVYLVANRIRNIDEIVKDSVDTVCCGCKLLGATLGCLHKGCSSRFHYLCAKEKGKQISNVHKVFDLLISCVQGCSMGEENFSIYCNKHKKKGKES
ncbi:Transcription factor 20-like protein [Leptotrombidium deliense]|uniref:Transcription factor 20-like protein n=1 Tax=Leptotrombidium deliense TaxID=299467 RepID=A0A443ST30_9ACAR|nr:Transcription factor 20-like protein [Leptotrombidium deliense]